MDVLVVPKRPANINHEYRILRESCNLVFSLRFCCVDLLKYACPVQFFAEDERSAFNQGVQYLIFKMRPFAFLMSRMLSQFLLNYQADLTCG